MGKPLYSSRLIVKEGVYKVQVLDITTPGRDGREFRIEVTDFHDRPVPGESRDVGVSGTWLATQRLSEIDLLAYLIQFRDELPEVITTAPMSLFKYPENDLRSKLYFVGVLIRTYFLTLGHDEPLEPDYLRNSIKIEFGEILSIVDTYASEGIVVGFEIGSSSVIARQGFSQAIAQFLATLVPISWSDQGGVTVVPEPVTMKTTTKGPTVKISPTSCQYPMFNGNPCGRPVFSGDTCVCHCNDRKDITEFRECVDDVLRDKKIYDFSGFVFPAEYVFYARRYYSRRLVLVECRFDGYVNFRDCVFDGDVYFKNCRFNGRVGFEFAHFCGDFEMRYCEAPSIDLSYAIIEDGFVFAGNKLMTKGGFEAEQLAEEDYFNLQGAVFQHAAGVFIKGIRPNDIALRGCNLAQAGHISFDSMSDEGVVSYSLADERPSQLKGVSHPPYVERHYLSVIDCYQQLEKHHLDSRRYDAAGQLYLREMEIKRSMGGWISRWIGVTAIYKWLGRYGEGYWRPAILLIAMLCLIPLLTMTLMEQPTYEWSCLHANPYGFVHPWFDDFMSNIETLSFMKGEPFKVDHELGCKPIPSGWRFWFLVERVLALVLISLIVVGARRRFRRY